MNHSFKFGTVWCEVAGGGIYFTGGMQNGISVNEVVRVSGRSMEVNQKAPMLSNRCRHGIVYDKNYLYAVG